MFNNWYSPCNTQNMELYIWLKLHVWFAGLGSKLLYFALKFMLHAYILKTKLWVKFFVAKMKVSQVKISSCLQFPNYFFLSTQFHRVPNVLLKNIKTKLLLWELTTSISKGKWLKGMSESVIVHWSLTLY